MYVLLKLPVPLIIVSIIDEYYNYLDDWLIMLINMPTEMSKMIKVEIFFEA